MQGELAPSPFRLSLSAETSRALIERLPFVVVVVEASEHPAGSLRVRYVNEAALGFASGRSPSAAASLLDLFPPLRGSALPAHVHEVLVSGREAWIDDFVYGWPHAHRVFRVFVVPLDAQSAAIVATDLAATMQDLSAISDLTTQLRRENARLSSAVEALRTNESAVVQRAQLRTASGLAAGLLHEVNSPLGTLNSAADVSLRCAQRLNDVLSESGSGAGPRPAELTKISRALDASSRSTRRAIERLSELTQELRQLVDPASEPKRSLALPELVRRAWQRVRAERATSVEMDLTSAPVPPIHVAPREIEFALTTLLGHAIDSSGSAGRISVDVASLPGAARVRITAHGAEQPAGSDLLDVRLAPRDARVRMGLGVHVAASIIERHGGQLQTLHPPGRATQIAISLPLDKANLV
jgi:signal transduction histidine kinase